MITAKLHFTIETLVDQVLKTINFVKQINVQQLPRQGERIEIRGQRATLLPFVNGIIWHLESDEATISLQMLRPLISVEVDALYGTGWKLLTNESPARRR